MAGYRFDKLRVLVVEDNQFMRRILVSLLKGFGVEDVREAGDGAAAMEILRQFPADLALVDLMMDPIDGIEFTKLLRTSEDTPNPFLPVIMVTCHTERRRVEAARDAGVTEFVAKPVTARALLERIGAIIDAPRPFVRTKLYFGPDRRRRHSVAYSGPLRRDDDHELAEAGN